MSYFIMEMATKIIAVLLVTLLMVLGVWLAIKFAKRDNLANIAAATKEAVDAAQRVVLELQQELVAGMKAASADGKLSKAEIDQLKALLVQKALAQMSQPAKRILEAAGTDLCGIIKSAGDGMILALKGNK